MKKITLITSLLVFAITSVKAQNSLKYLASYQATKLKSEDSAAETIAYDTTNKHAFFTNSSTNEFTIIDISTPATPTLIKTVSLSTYGAGPNSIAIKGGIVAIAVEANTKQDAGKVVFFDLEGDYINMVTVGALPDMLIFTPDGKKVLVANEGEPSSDYTNDPEGTISVVDISAGVASASVSSISFNEYDNKKVSLKNKGVRIFGNNGASSVSQDLEPEYITVIEDGTKAYVSCQENNALVVVDLLNNSILDILPLGYKNHNLGTPKVTQYVINDLVTNWPTLGTPVYDSGQPTVNLGGFSGLFYDAKNSTTTNYVFYAVPDRGPNDAPVKKATDANNSSNTPKNLRPFKLPNYQGRIVKFTLNKTTGAVTLDDQILLTRKDGTTPITGKGNIPGVDEVPVTYTDAATAYTSIDYTLDTEEYHALPYDAYGGDFEGVLRDKDGNFWACDEYRPALYKFQSNGTLIERYVASGTSTLGTTAQSEGAYGAETLPAVYAKRRANRGFEAIAYDEANNTIYGFIQSPMYNPSSATKNNSDVIRILGINADNGMPVSEYVYLLERNKDAGYASSRVDKIGDAVCTGNGKFLVIERDSEGPTVAYGKKYVFEIDINFATNILNTTLTGDKELEELTADEIAAQGILAVHKTKMINLPSVGYQGSDKAEGIALLPNNEIAVINDNDFGLAGAGITDNSVLGIISFANDYGFDASNKDDKINITQHPTLGMFMPDAITSYKVGDVNYIVTANEGDSRDYEYEDNKGNTQVGYSEEVRVKDLTLNSTYYPNAAELQESADLGRLKTTTATGDYNNDGTIEQIYSYGTRSFSIFDEYGNLVFDSADEFGQKIATEEAALFNQDDGKFDGRSDDKGGEPEAVTVGAINGKTYAFVGLERQSSILMYDITNPKDVEFITYYKGNTASGDMAPEIIKFVSAADSPNSKNLLLVGYEVSGTLGIIEIDETALSVSKVVAKNDFKMYPNPVVQSNLKFNKTLSGVIYNISGQEVKRFENETVLNVSQLLSGVYIIKTKTYGVKRFVKL